MNDAITLATPALVGAALQSPPLASATATSDFVALLQASTTQLVGPPAQTTASLSVAPPIAAEPEDGETAALPGAVPITVVPPSRVAKPADVDIHPLRSPTHVGPAIESDPPPPVETTIEPAFAVNPPPPNLAAPLMLPERSHVIPPQPDASAPVAAPAHASVVHKPITMIGAEIPIDTARIQAEQPVILALPPNFARTPDNAQTPFEPATPNNRASIERPPFLPIVTQDLRQQISILTGDRPLHFNVRPETLGPVAVSIALGEEGRSLRLGVENATALQAIRQAEPQLIDMINRGGTNFVQVTVDLSGRDQRSRAQPPVVTRRPDGTLTTLHEPAAAPTGRFA